jgi:hypothetical protein
MKYLIITVCLFWGVFLAAQTKVTKKIAAKSNDFGITYTLPKTSLIVNAEVIKITAKAGPYFRYAEKYLGIKNAVTEDKTYYQLGKVSILNKGIPDAENTYIVDFKPGTVAPYAFLTEDGRLCTINADYVPKDETGPAEVASPPSPPAPALPVYTEELLMAGSTARQAEVAAKQIYRIRESRLNILTGEADNLPPDGEAMKLVIQQLEQQEKALANLFTGTTAKETSYYDVSLVPYENLEREVLFRFSEPLGIVDADDLSGTPVYLNLKSLEPPAPPADPKETEKKLKLMKGIIYNIPGKAQVEIFMNRKSLLKDEIMVVQFGTRENLAPAVFEDKKTPVKVYFYPETGAIKQIIQ